MSYSNSSLVNCTIKSPNHSGTRTHKIDRITPHCVVGQLTAEGIGSCFTSSGREASCNYGIGYDGRVCLVVDEANRSWCSSSNENDQRAVTIECASDTTSPYAFKDACYNKLVKLCIDICKRNGLKKVIWFGDKSKSLNYSPASGECVLTVHRWFANKACPGDWLYNRMSQLAAAINKGLGSSSSSSTVATTTSTTTSSGSATIKAVQKWVGVTQDGIYGAQTKKALVKMLQTELNKQCRAGLTVDGIWGNNTRNAIAKYATLKQGMSGNLTKTLQGLLICNGYSTNGFDGVYGSGTASAVKKYQSAKGLTSDGIAGANTFAKLCS